MSEPDAPPAKTAETVGVTTVRYEPIARTHDLIQDKARQLGITSQDVATVLNCVVGGSTATQIRDQIYLVDVVRVAPAPASARPSRRWRTSRSRPRTGAPSRSPPSTAFHDELEQPIVWRRDRVPTITIKAAPTSSVQPATVVAQLKPEVDAFIGKPPPAYEVETGGAVEESAKGQGAIAAVAP